MPIASSPWSPAEQDVLNSALRRVRPHRNLSAVDVSDISRDALHDVLDERDELDDWDGDLFWEAVEVVCFAALANDRRIA